MSVSEVIGGETAFGQGGCMCSVRCGMLYQATFADQHCSDFVSHSPPPMLFMIIIQERVAQYEQTVWEGVKQEISHP